MMRCSTCWKVSDRLRRPGGAGAYHAQLLWVFFDGLRVQYLSVVLAHVEVLGVMLGQLDLLPVVAQLQVCGVVLGLGLLLDLALLLPLLLLLFELLWCRLGFPGQVPGADLAAEDAGLCPVAVLDAELHLGEDELGLLTAVHRPERLDLEFAEGFGGALEVALLLLDVGEDLGHASPLHLDEDLALGHGAQGLDDGQLGLQAGCLVEKAHDGLDHLGDGLFELAMFLGEHQGLVAEEAPVAGIPADGDDADEDS